MEVCSTLSFLQLLFLVSLLITYIWLAKRLSSNLMRLCTMEIYVWQRKDNNVSILMSYALLSMLIGSNWHSIWILSTEEEKNKNKRIPFELCISCRLQPPSWSDDLYLKPMLCQVSATQYVLKNHQGPGPKNRNKFNLVINKLFNV